MQFSGHCQPHNKGITSFSVFVYHFLSCFSHSVSCPPTCIYYSGANLVIIVCPKMGTFFQSQAQRSLCNYCLCFCNKWYDVVLQKNLMEVEYGHCLSLALPFGDGYVI